MSQSSSHSITEKVDGVAFEVTGPSDAPVIVFGHSLLFDHRMWAPQVAELSKDFRCVAIDFRGHGQSDEPKAGMTILDYAEDYGKVLDHLGVESAIFVGLSMGGMTAMPFALAHPSRVRALVLMDTSADPEPRGARARNQAMAVTARLFGVSDFIMKRVNDLMWSKRFQAERPDIVDLWSERVKALSRRGLYRSVGIVMGRKAIGPRLAELRCPTLVIVGDEDKATSPETNRKVADTIPGAELKLLPRTGHIANLEEPDLVNKLIRTFITKLA